PAGGTGRGGGPGGGGGPAAGPGAAAPAGGTPPAGGPAPQALAAAKAGAAATPAPGVVRVATAQSISAIAITKAGLPVTVTVPARVNVLRFRVLNAKRKVLFTTFQTVKAGKRAKLDLRSAALRRHL